MFPFLSVFLSLIALALSILALSRSSRTQSAVLLTEGYATAAALNAASGHPVAVVQAPDPWVDTIQPWLALHPDATLTPDAILAGALPGTPSTRATSARLTAAMKACGYRAVRTRIPGRDTATRVFVPITPKTPAAPAGSESAP